MNFFRLPTVNLLRLVIEDPVDLAYFGNIKPSVLQRNLVGTIIKYADIDTTKLKQVICKFDYTDTSVRISCKLLALFYTPWLEPVDTNDVEPNNLYGVRISNKTQIIMCTDSSILAHFELAAKSENWILRNVDRNFDQERTLLQLHSVEVVSSVKGIFESAFYNSIYESAASPQENYLSRVIKAVSFKNCYKNGSLSSSVHSLLLIGDSGSGASSLATAIANDFGAFVLNISAGTFYARAVRNTATMEPNDNVVNGLHSFPTRGATANWARQELQKAIMCIRSLGADESMPCVLLLSDLHALAPRRGKESQQIEAETGLIEVT